MYGSDTLPVIDLTGRVNSPLVDVPVTLLLRYDNIDATHDSQVKPVYENVTVTVPGEYVQTDDLNAAPTTIPALREWYGSQGYITFTKESRIVINPIHQGVLESTGKVTQNDLHDVTGISVDIIYGNPQASDVYLTIDASSAYLGKEGYCLHIDDYVSIQAATAIGVFYGTRSLLQILKQAAGCNRLPKGTARDYPKYESRGLMIDVARKFYSIEFLRDYVKLLAWYKMNRLQIHLNDDVSTPFLDGSKAAFRLESTVYPGLSSKTGHYTKLEFRALQQLGLDYGVSVIPEIDTPGHSRAFTQYDPALGTDRNLDIARPETINFVKKLFDEYLDGDEPTFVGPEVHIGTDEYAGKDVEPFRFYMDTLINHIHSKGKHPRLWGGLTKYHGQTPVSTGATMDIWHEPYGAAQQAIDLGYNIVNVHYVLLYIVPRIYRDYLNNKSLYEKWEPNDWVTTVLPAAHPRVKGAMVCLWNDVSDAKGFSMDDSHASMLPSIQVIAEKTWVGTRSSHNFLAFRQLADVIGEAPGTNISHKLHVSNSDGIVVIYHFNAGFSDRSGNGFSAMGTNVALVEGRTGHAAKFYGGESYIETPLESLGFGWTLSMWINPDAENPDNAILMESPASQLKLRQGSTGQLGFTKEHYHSAFQYEVPVGVWTHLWLTGDSQGVALCVNGGEYVERLYPQDRKAPIHTLVLPMARIGSSTHAFKGRIDEVTVYNRVIDLPYGESEHPTKLGEGLPQET